MTEEHTPEPRELNHPAYEAINWNNVSDFDREVWEKLTSNFWLESKISLSNDKKTWDTLSEGEKKLVLHVFTGLTKLDTVQGRFAAPALVRDATNMFEEAIYSNIGFMEFVHAKSYSYIFSTLSNTKDINASFRWADENEFLQKKIEIIMSYYRGNPGDSHEDLRRKVASTLLESFLFYSGFYLPLYLNSQAKLTNTGDIIKLIIRDEAVHGYYIGAKFQEGYKKISKKDQEEIQEWTYELLMELYDNEVKYTQDLYDEFGLSEEVIAFLKYNANKALQNLGFDQLFPAPEVSASIKSQLNSGGDTHDFFSGSGASYTMTKVEELAEEDWDEY